MHASRYVILHHEDRAGEHWDFMIERPAGLATWKMATDPAAGDLPAKGTRIADHRKHYLDYEGPISGDRGRVQRVDEGTCRIDGIDDHGWRFRLQGRRLCGAFVLRKVSDRNDWVLETGPVENSQAEPDG